MENAITPPPITPENPPITAEKPSSGLTIKKFLMVLPFVIILIFILSAIKKDKPNLLPNPTPTPTPKVDSWKTYSDELQTYQIQAPAVWEWITHSSNFINMHFITLKALDNSVFQSSAQEVKNQTLSSYLSARDKTDAAGWEGQPSKKIVSSKNVTVGNYPGVERVEEWLAAGYTTIVTYTKAGEYIYEFSIQPSEIDYRNSQVYKNYYQIIASFKLISQTNISPTCRPRPPCLDSEPRCLIPETEDMCPPNPPGKFCGGIAGIACPPGFECKLDGKFPDAGGTCWAVSAPIPTSPPTPIIKTGCKIGGCSSELCLDAKSEDVTSICIYRDEYACYKYSVCEKGNDNKCSWTRTPEYLSCLEKL